MGGDAFMKCENCGEREAVVHLTQIEDSRVTTVHLCERCAAERGVEPPPAGKTPLGSFLAAMGEAEGPADETLQRCPGCGATFAAFRETGRLGCAQCWSTFEMPLRDLVRRLHGSTVHMGERYVGAQADLAVRAEEDLRERLRVAIETENFELAAELRDRLRQ
jgi:protein arginine kinase activator